MVILYSSVNGVYMLAEGSTLKFYLAVFHLSDGSSVNRYIRSSSKGNCIVAVSKLLRRFETVRRVEMYELDGPGRFCTISY